MQVKISGKTRIKSYKLSKPDFPITIKVLKTPATNTIRAMPPVAAHGRSQAIHPHFFTVFACKTVKESLTLHSEYLVSSTAKQVANLLLGM
jgi:hypothetical protein